jgi:hypothetical protein
MNRLALVLLLLGPAVVSSQEAPPDLPIPASDADVTIDGVLDEPVWSRAARAGNFFQFRPVDSRPAEDSTVVLVWYSPTAIHFGILAYDREPGTVRATLSDRDNIGSDDQVMIYLDTFNDRRRAYFFGVNPFGIQDDGVRSEGGFSASSGGSGNTDRNPDFIWESKGQLTPFGWSAEIRVPYKTLRWGGGEDLTWGFNVQRTTRRTGYEDTWTDVRRANASFLAQAGTISGISGIRRGIVTELQPTLTMDLNGMRQPDGSFDRDDIGVDLGGNVRFGFTKMTLDGTINPDFSQVESDAGLVTINERFALFFPERRPFFLEGIELFASPNTLIFTRTVTDPLAGAKLTGKLGSWSVAHLTAVDEFGQARDGGVDSDTRAFVNLTRLRRDVGENSVAGLTLTNRDEDGDYNRVLAADTRLVFKKLYYLQVQAGASITRDGRDDDVRSDPIWEVEVDRTGRAFGFNYKVTALGEDFESWSGFVNRTGIVTGRASNRYTAYGARGALVEQATVFGSLNRIWDDGELFGDRPIEGSSGGNWSLRLRGGWNLSGTLNNDFVRFDPDDYTRYSVAAPGGSMPFDLAEGSFDMWNGNVSISTPTFRQWDASIRLQTGRSAIFPEAARGTLNSATASLTLRPTSAVRVFGTLRVQELNRVSDGSEFGRTILPRLKVEVQPDRSFFFRLVAEYRSERQSALRDPTTGSPILINGLPGAARQTDQLRMDWLASYEPTPGTVAFFGYGATLNGDSPLTIRGLERTDDGFFVKLAYLFRN